MNTTFLINLFKTKRAEKIAQCEELIRESESYSSARHFVVNAVGMIKGIREGIYAVASLDNEFKYERFLEETGTICKDIDETNEILFKYWRANGERKVINQ